MWRAMKSQAFYDYKNSLILLVSGMYLPPKSAIATGKNYLVILFWHLYSYATTFVFFFMLTAGCVSLFEPSIDKISFFENLHYILVILVVGSMRLVHIRESDKIDDILSLIERAVSFEGNEKSENLKKAGVLKIKRKKKFFLAVMTFWVTGFTLFTPIQGVIAMDHRETFFNKKILNLPTYLTFLDETPEHIILGLIIFVISTGIIFFTVLAIFEAYVSVTVQLQTLFNLLCEFLERIESRVLEKCQNRECLNFEDGTLICLKENAIQYQIIKRSVEHGLPYFERVFTVLAFLASITIATAGYMFTQVQLEKGDWLKYLTTFCGEGLFTFFICQSAERIKNSCQNVFEHFAWTPWYRYSVNYRKDSSFLMLSAKKPILVQARPFKINASNETFYWLMRGTINYMTLLKSF